MTARHRARGRLRSIRLAVVVGLVAAALCATSDVVWQASYAALSGTTSNAGSSLTAKSRFGCGDRVVPDGAIDYWKLTESSGTTAADSIGSARPGTYSASGVTFGAKGPCDLDGDTAVTLSGGASVGVTSSPSIDPNTLSSYSEEIWFKTTSTSGGLLLGLWASQTAVAGNRDRVLFLSTDGKVVFGVFNTTTLAGVKIASAAGYNDGKWHNAISTFTSGTLSLYVDGSQVDTATPAGFASYTGAAEYWRIGYGDLSYADWIPSSSGTPASAFTGSLAQASVYASALTTAQIANQWGTRTPLCATAVLADSPSLYWKLGESSGTTATDSSGSSRTGTYTATGTLTYGVTGPCPIDGSTGVTLANANGTSNGVVPASYSVGPPTAFSSEVWFKTTTTNGGLLVGLFDNRTAGAVKNLLYMNRAGTIGFGVWSGAFNWITSSSTYNDGSWHLATATWSGATKMRLYVDGALVASNSSGPTTNVAPATGNYWRVGYGDTASWGDLGSNRPGFAGSLAGAAVYGSELSASRVLAHWTAP